MSVSMKDRKTVIYGEVERLRDLLDRQSQEIERLKARVSALTASSPAPAPARSAFAIKAEARRAATRRILAANPGRRSVTLAEVDAYLEAQR